MSSESSLAESLERRVDHWLWADRRVADALGSLPAEERREALRLFAHVVTTERIYYERLGGLDPWPQDFWPTLDIGDCLEIAERAAANYRGYLAAATEDALQRPVAYRDSSGRAHRTAPAQMIEHVSLHGSYHRGQIASLLRVHGSSPVATDFILFVRGDD